MDAACTYTPPFDAQWIMGNQEAVRAVAPALQPQALALLKDALLVPIEPAQASAWGGGTPAAAKHLYLAKAAFIGKPGDSAQDVTFHLDLTATGTAYVASFRVTRDHASTTQAAVILASDRPLTGIVSICGAAE